MKAPDVSPEDIQAALTDTFGFSAAVGTYLDAQPAGRPLAGSPLERECRAFSDADAVIVAYDHGGLLMKLAADHLVALARALSPPYLSMASWTALRMVLESAALSAWLLDPSVDARTRVGRSYARRFAGLKEQVSFAASMNSAGVPEAEQLRDSLTASANALGFPPLLNRKRQTIGVGEPLPNSTQLVDEVFSQGPLYKLLSGFVHGHPWAFFKLSFATIDDGTGPRARAVQRMEPFHMLGHLVNAALWFARPVWYMSRLNGYDLPVLAAILDKHFSRAPEEMRFWRPLV